MKNRKISYLSWALGHTCYCSVGIKAETSTMQIAVARSTQFIKTANLLKWLWFSLLLFGVFSLNQAQAQFTIEGSGGESRLYSVGLPIILGDVPTQSGKLQELLLEDLRLSGLFKVVGISESENNLSPNISSWKGKSDFLILGSLSTPNSNKKNTREVIIQLFDVARGVQLEGLKVSFDSRQIAIATHKIADAVVERFTGIQVGFSQLLAMVVKNGRQYSIQVSDIFGKNSHSILNSTNPIISLSWSPDGSSLAYASFEEGPSKVFIQDVLTGKRQSIKGNFLSMSAPTWSPDGKKIAFAGYASQKTSIYEYDLQTKKIQSLVHKGSINTEPVYGNDGYLYFSSNRSSSPQIYRLKLSTKKVDRFSFDNKYCIRPSTAKYKPLVAYLNREGRGVSIANTETGSVTELPLSARAESVAISPHGRLLLLSVPKGRRFHTIITNIQGTYKRVLDIKAHSYYEPSWRPRDGGHKIF